MNLKDAKNIIAILAFAFALNVPAFINAQDTREPARVDTRADDHKDFGWIGLLGLAGLFGLIRRDREHDVVRGRDRVVNPR